MDSNRVEVYGGIIYDIMDFFRTLVEKVQEFLAGIKIGFNFPSWDDEAGTDD